MLIICGGETPTKFHGHSHCCVTPSGASVPVVYSLTQVMFLSAWLVKRHVTYTCAQHASLPAIVICYYYLK